MGALLLPSLHFRREISQTAICTNSSHFECSFNLQSFLTCSFSPCMDFPASTLLTIISKYSAFTQNILPYTKISMSQSTEDKRRFSHLSTPKKHHKNVFLGDCHPSKCESQTSMEVVLHPCSVHHVRSFYYACSLRIRTNDTYVSP